jgi:hypothetical protein
MCGLNRITSLSGESPKCGYYEARDSGASSLRASPPLPKKPEGLG